FPRRGAIESEMSALQGRAIFDRSLLLLWQMVHSMAETRREHVAVAIQIILAQLEVYTRQEHPEEFYDLIFQGMAQQHEMVGNPYLMRYYQELLPCLRRSYFLTLNISRRELQESFDLFKLVTEAILIRKTHQAALFMEDFCRHLRNLVLES